MAIFAGQYQSEDAARAHLESLLWPDGPVCPGCGIVDEATRLQREEGAETHGRKGLYQCRACRRQFTVTVGTIFEDSHVPLHKWLLAIHLICSSKKGMSALQLQRELWGENPNGKDKHGRPALLGSYRTASFVCRRVRWAMTQSPAVEAFANHTPLPEAVAVRLLLNVKPGEGMPRPGKRRSKSVFVELNEELGPISPRSLRHSSK